MKAISNTQLIKVIMVLIILLTCTFALCHAQRTITVQAYRVIKFETVYSTTRTPNIHQYVYVANRDGKTGTRYEFANEKAHTIAIRAWWSGRVSKIKLIVK